MKKIFIFLLFLGLLAVPVSLYALDLGTGITQNAAKQAGFAEGTSETTLAETIGLVIQIALSFVGILFTVLIVYAGFLWMTARGDEGKVDKALKIIRSALVGLIITLAAYSITAFVIPRLLERTTGSGGGDGTVGSPTNQPVVGCCKCDTTGQDLEDGGGDVLYLQAFNNADCRNRCFSRLSPFANYFFENKPADQCPIQ